ncbi:MAG: MarR family transcriptional regulator [Actinomycetota bacterium]
MASPPPTDDPTDALADQWAAARPDLDVSAMVTVARLNRLVALVRRDVDRRIGGFGVTTGEFDVLSALRRSPAPHRLKPSELARQTMLSPSGMTNRIDRLEGAGLVARTTDPDNQRVAPVMLTDAGLALIDRLIDDHVSAQTEVLSALSAGARRQLDDQLRVLLAEFGDR